MKRILLLPIILLVLSFTGRGQSSQWIPYTSTEGHYSINFPDKPEVTVEDDTSAGYLLKIHFASYTPNDDVVLMAGWIDMSAHYDNEKTMKEMLEGSRDGAAGSMKASNVVTITTNLKDDPYIEFVFSTDAFTGKDRIYIINKVQYSLITIFSLKDGISPDADKFIGSFKHTL
jgi:hypothetical protein